MTKNKIQTFEVRYKLPLSNKQHEGLFSFQQEPFGTYREARDRYDVLKAWQKKKPERGDSDYDAYRLVIGHFSSGVIVTGIYRIDVITTKVHE